jgi:hypothetical protein
MRARSPVSRVGSQARELLESARYENRVVYEIAMREATGLADQPEQPFEPGALHPSGCARLCPGVEIEGGADADQRSRIDLADMRRHPFFLFRHAEPDPDEIGARPVDCGDIGRVFFLRSEGGTEAIGIRQ